MTSDAAHWALPLAGAIGAVILFTALSIFGRKRGLEFLDRWAREQGYTLVSASRRSFVSALALDFREGASVLPRHCSRRRRRDSPQLDTLLPFLLHRSDPI